MRVDSDMVIDHLRRGIMIREFVDYLKDEDGQTSTEYILLVAVVAVIIFKFKDRLQTKLLDLVDKVFVGADGIVDGLQ